MQASFRILNKTNPNLTEGCSLCYNIQPPFYEAIGVTAKARRVNGTSPSQCHWKRDKENTNSQGITLSQVTGKGRCIGAIPRDKQHLCEEIIRVKDSTPPAEWLLPAANTKWVCQGIGVTPCLSLKLFNHSNDYCIQVTIIPIYHSMDYVIDQHTTREHYLVKREPFTALTIAALLTVGGVGAGTGVTSLVTQHKEFRELRISVDEDLSRIEQAIDGLVKSVRSLSEVVLQNRRGLDLLFLQQGRLCVALKEECCAYADHTGVVIDTMVELRKQLEQRKKEREAHQSWYES